MSSVDDPPDLYLKFGGHLVEQLGAQMYPSATSTVAELISNAWDADARHVWVEMPYGDWINGEIVVTDDGVGMGLATAQDAYLVVGRNRRSSSGQRSAGGRLVHGRKGIGKLAAFGTARILELMSVEEGGEAISFRLDYSAIRRQDPDVAYKVGESSDLGQLVSPDSGEPLSHGTRIRLTDLRLKRRLNEDQFLAGMSRRFALNDREMAVYINGTSLRRFSLDLEIRIPPREIPPEASQDGDWAVEHLSDGREVRWWIGFTAKPLKGEADQGISVLVRGKMAQRPFKFEQNTGGGTTGQLGQEYLVGEIIADWIDDQATDDIDHDLIQSNRDQLQLEDDDLDAFLEWGRRRLRWALEARNGIRRRQNQDRLKQNKELERLFGGRPKREQDALRRVAEAVAKLPDSDDTEVVKVMEAVIRSMADETAQDLARDIGLATGGAGDLWPLVRDLAELDGCSTEAFLEVRLETLAQLAALSTADEASEVIQGLMTISPGLLDPAWDFAEIEDLSDLQIGVPAFLVKPPSRADQPMLVLIAGADLSALDRVHAVESLRTRYGDVPLWLLIGDEADDRRETSGAHSFPLREFFDRSAELHEAWMGLVRDRVERVRTSRP